MRTLLLVLLVLGSLSVVHSGVVIDDFSVFNRGDVNGDGNVDISDPVYLSNWLFAGGDAPPCLNDADANDDGDVDNSDIIYLLNYLGGGPAPPYPGVGNSECVEDPAPRPGCENPNC